MKTLKSYIWMAAATMMVATFGACSSEDLTTNESPMTPEKQGKVVTLTATLGPKDGTTTRSVMTDNLDGTISTAWEVGDKIWVNYDNNSSQKVSAKGEVSAVDGSGNATITVKLIDPKDASIIVFGFPYDHWAEGKDPHIGQLGTLEDINLHHAAISGIGSLSVSGSDATLPTSVSMNKEMCIWKFTFKDGDTDITSNITHLNINCGVGDDYVVTPTSQSAIYVALYPQVSSDITITAATASGIYSKSATGINLDNGKMYTSANLKLTKVSNNVNLASKTANYTAANGDILSGTLDPNYRLTIPAGATVIFNDAVIKYNKYDAAAVTCLGDATIVLVGDDNDVRVPGDTEGGSSGSQYPAIQAGGTGTTLTITGAGSLLAQGGFIAAGIGNMNDLGPGTTTICGKIQINGGNVSAYSGNKIMMGDGAEGGIGGVEGGNDKCEGVIINGGFVTAMGGVGLGQCTDVVIINGGTIMADGLSYGMGIYATDIIISNCTMLSAMSSGGNAAIIADNDITIHNGTVNAVGAGGGEGIIAFGTTTINGGTIQSIAYDNAGIGLEGNVVINGGTVTATGAAANGGSDGNGGAGFDGALTVKGGVLTATGGAKDGSGEDGLGISGASTITLGDGIIFYEGDDADPTTPAANQGECTKRYVIIK